MTPTSAADQLHELAQMAVATGMFEAAAFIYDRLARDDIRVPRRRAKETS